MKNCSQSFSSLLLLLSLNMTSNFKNGSLRQLFLTTQGKSCLGKLQMKFAVLHSDLGWFILTLKPLGVSPIVFSNTGLLFIVHNLF